MQLANTTRTEYTEQRANEQRFASSAAQNHFTRDRSGAVLKQAETAGAKAST